DCADGSDENAVYCNRSCNSGEIRCLNPIGTLQCISKALMCNGVRDCADGSDENSKYCGKIQSYFSALPHNGSFRSSVAGCNAGEIRCLNPGNGRQCVPRTFVCDKFKDCADGSDEDPKFCVANCTAAEVRCVSPGNGLLCVSKASVCNGIRECADGSDEDPNYCGKI
ncbi:unnamed protein product, partial [Rotaria magnacalcarata]